MSQPAPRRQRHSLAKRLVPSKNIYVVLHISLISLVYVGFFFVIIDSLWVYSDYKNFARDVLNAQNIATCPTDCSFNLTSQWRDPQAVIVVDNPSGTLVLLRLYTTQHKEVWVATDRTTRINATFDGGLYVDVYPLYPLSDADQRHIYLPGNGNLTIHVTPPAIGGIVQPLQVVISAVVGLLTILGIIRHLSKTPAVNALGSTYPTYMRILLYPSLIFTVFLIFIVFVIILIIVVVIPKILLHFILNCTLIVITTLFLSVAFLTYLLTIIVQPRQISTKDSIILIILTLISFVGLLFIFMNNRTVPWPLYSNTLFLTFVNPFSLFLLKSLAVISGIRRTEKVGVLHLYDLAVLVWALQWLANPYPTIFKLDYITISFLIILIMLIIILGSIIFIISLNPRILLFSIIPFIFNEELVARIEFCKKARIRIILATIYPWNGRPMRGFVHRCDVDKIVLLRLRNYRQYTFSWSEIRWIIQ